MVSILVNSTCQSVQKTWYILYYSYSIKGIVLAYLQPKGKRKCSDYVGICSAFLLKSTTYWWAIYTIKLKLVTGWSLGGEHPENKQTNKGIKKEVWGKGEH